MLRKRSMASLFVGVNTTSDSKESSSPDAADPARSPTSPLDHTAFSNLGSPLAASPRSPRVAARRSWDSGRVGLGLVDALLDSSSIVFAPQMRSCRVAPGGRGIVEEIQTMSCPSRADFLRREPRGELSSSLPPLFLGSICAGDLEMSEDYTRITTHGPNPKTTHIFGDRILEEDRARVLEGKEEEPFPSMGAHGFLSSCCSCRKKLRDGEDIYMYRGDQAFCSSECRNKEMSIDGGDVEMEDIIPLMV